MFPSSACEFVDFIEGKGAFKSEDEYDSDDSFGYYSDEEEEFEYENNSDFEAVPAVPQPKVKYCVIESQPQIVHLYSSAVRKGQVCEFFYEENTAEEPRAFVKLPCSNMMCTTCFENFLEVANTISGLNHIENRVFLIRKESNVLEIYYSRFFIKCPFMNCNCFLDEKILATYSRAQSAKMARFVHMMIKSADPNLTYCPFCSNEDAECYPFKGMETYNVQKCTKCDLFHCKLCKGFPHFKKCSSTPKLFKNSKFLSEVVKARQFVEFSFVSWAKTADLRRCPGCNTPIEKNGGCDHMLCRSCNKSFNWSGASCFSLPGLQLGSEQRRFYEQIITPLDALLCQRFKTGKDK